MTFPFDTNTIAEKLSQNGQPVSDARILEVFYEGAQNSNEPTSRDTIVTMWKDFLDKLPQQIQIKEKAEDLQSLVVSTPQQLQKSYTYRDILRAAWSISMPYWVAYKHGVNWGSGDERSRYLEQCRYDVNDQGVTTLSPSTQNAFNSEETSAFYKHWTANEITLGDNSALAVFKPYADINKTLDMYDMATCGKLFIEQFAKDIKVIGDTPQLQQMLPLASGSWSQTIVLMHQAWLQYLARYIDHLGEQYQSLQFQASMMKILLECGEGFKVASDASMEETLDRYVEHVQSNLSLAIFPVVTQEEQARQEKVYGNLTKIRDTKAADDVELIRMTMGISDTQKIEDLISTRQEIPHSLFDARLLSNILMEKRVIEESVSQGDQDESPRDDERAIIATTIDAKEGVQQSGSIQNLNDEDINALLKQFYSSNAMLIYEIDTARCPPEIYIKGLQRLWNDFVNDKERFKGEKLAPLAQKLKEISPRVLKRIAEYNPQNTSGLRDELMEPFYGAMVQAVISTSEKSATERQMQFAKAFEAVALIWLYPKLFDAIKNSVSEKDIAVFQSLINEERSQSSLEKTTFFLDQHQEIVSQIYLACENSREDLRSSVPIENRNAVLRVFVPTCLSQLTNGKHAPRMLNNGLINIDQYCISETTSSFFQTMPGSITSSNISSVFEDSTKGLLKIFSQDMQSLYPDLSVLDASFSQIQFTEQGKERETIALAFMQMQQATLTEKFAKGPSYKAKLFDYVLKEIYLFLYNYKPDINDSSSSFYDKFQTAVTNFKLTDEFTENLVEIIIATAHGRATEATWGKDDSPQIYKHNLKEDLGFLLKREGGGYHVLQTLLTTQPFSQDTKERSYLFEVLTELLREGNAEVLPYFLKNYKSAAERNDNIELESMVNMWPKGRSYQSGFLEALDNNEKPDEHGFIQIYLEEHLAKLPDFGAKSSIECILLSNLPVEDKLRMLGAIGEAKAGNNTILHGRKRSVQNFYLGLSHFSGVSAENIDEKFKNFRQKIGVKDSHYDVQQIERDLQRKILRESNQDAKNFETQFKRWINFSNVSKDIVEAQDLATIKVPLTLQALESCRKAIFNVEHSSEPVASNIPSEQQRSLIVHQQESSSVKVPRSPQERATALEDALRITAIQQGCFEKKVAPRRDSIISQDGNAASQSETEVSTDSVVSQDELKKVQEFTNQVLLEQLKKALKQFSGNYASTYFLAMHHLPKGMQQIVTMLNNNDIQGNSNVVVTILQKLQDISKVKVQDNYSQLAGRGGLRSGKTQAAYEAINSILKDKNFQAGDNITEHNASLTEVLREVVQKLNEIHRSGLRQENKIAETVSPIHETWQVRN